MDGKFAFSNGNELEWTSEKKTKNASVVENIYFFVFIEENTETFKVKRLSVEASVFESILRLRLVR